jgi:broad specificity phosphatase PhoE
MSTIYIIRHGQASFGAQNYDQLSPLGYEQASFLGNHIHQLNLDIQEVVIGEMKRHAQTAENSLSKIGFSNAPIIDGKWNEYDHVEILSRYRSEYADIEFIKNEIFQLPQPMVEFQKIFEGSMMRWASGNYPTEYKESWEEMRERTIVGLNTIKERLEPNKTILVYTSAGTISALLSKLLDLNVEEAFKLQWKIPNCSISSIKIEENRIVVKGQYESHFFEMKPNLLTYR